ncbi:hypothetical protein DFA_01075 [Cavenderia fasciculata]|uniref:Uncharacterized protein n=1 Tax=Cavenderia fasciculata TaxID=261658 RepID=F4PQN3_CACFS|nr:uncharacterized protein DFA_01075 [Cavenderia fasciculata]EGG21200.1 hypothetical protein DFA_01075 [Cavenderia fasciculata]|eukprot:XP_004359050.1 hypothetical protein DFA_01075 [Cavenderia fasciculata]
MVSEQPTTYHLLHATLVKDRAFKGTISVAPHKITDDFVEKTYYYAGGSARFAFGQTTDIDIVKDGFVSSTDFDQCWRAMGDVASEDTVSSNVIHREVNSSFTNFTGIFASDWVAAQVLTQKLIDTSLPLANYFNSTSEAHKLMVGHLYEQFAIKSLMKRATFKIKSKEKEQTFEFTSPGGALTFGSIDKWTEPNTLYIPKDKSFPAIDLLLTPNLLFQITKAKDHKPLPSVKQGSQSLPHLCGGFI